MRLRKQSGYGVGVGWNFREGRNRQNGQTVRTEWTYTSPSTNVWKVDDHWVCGCGNSTKWELKQVAMVPGAVPQADCSWVGGKQHHSKMGGVWWDGWPVRRDNLANHKHKLKLN
eukprot:TRINITY_DN59059_c0_g1_i1.p2 TRINITY_DN59059_c0_g1~~TRINITY_DN59059_c0_g1_i1.p2  ORF type:complete len:114 (-),score=9.51 TRINITY_DN59059_c0_g1_i1:496-837(-)